MNFWAGLALLGIAESNKNNPNSLLDLNELKKAEKYVVEAECIDKYTGADSYMYVVFKMEDGNTVSLPVPVQKFGEIRIGDRGQLYWGNIKKINVFGSWTPFVEK